MITITEVFSNSFLCPLYAIRPSVPLIRCCLHLSVSLRDGFLASIVSALFVCYCYYGRRVASYTPQMSQRGQPIMGAVPCLN